MFIFKQTVILWIPKIKSWHPQWILQQSYTDEYTFMTACLSQFKQWSFHSKDILRTSPSHMIPLQTKTSLLLKWAVTSLIWSANWWGKAHTVSLNGIYVSPHDSWLKIIILRLFILFNYRLNDKVCTSSLTLLPENAVFGAIMFLAVFWVAQAYTNGSISYLFDCASLKQII
jgi:hypothetical protein